MTKLLIASGNRGKIVEIRALLDHLELELIEPHTLGIRLQIDEETDSYVENSRRKALAYARASGVWSLGDDSGLEVDALEGLPGPLSARLAGSEASDPDRRSVLLRFLEAHPKPWTASFRCVISLASPQGRVELSQGSCNGEIIDEERGEHGFGYDPIFLVGDTGKTMAELTLQEKNRLSHRAEAMRAILPVIIERLGIDDNK